MYKLSTSFQHGFADTWTLFKLGADVPISDWLPPGARPPRPPGTPGLVHIPAREQPKSGVFRRIWSKVKGLPLAAKIGLGAGAGLLGGAALLHGKENDDQPSRYDNYNTNPELQAIGYGQRYRSRY